MTEQYIKNPRILWTIIIILIIIIFGYIIWTKIWRAEVQNAYNQGQNDMKNNLTTIIKFSQRNNNILLEKWNFPAFPINYTVENETSNIDWGIGNLCDVYNIAVGNRCEKY